MFIVPSLMHLAGDWAWWLPKWLDRLIPNVDVEGAALDRRHPHVAREHTGMDLEADGAQIRPGGTRRMPIPVQAPANAE
jgi:RND superfamily putative drug exporter